MRIVRCLFLLYLKKENVVDIIVYLAVSKRFDSDKLLTK